MGNIAPVGDVLKKTLLKLYATAPDTYTLITNIVIPTGAESSSSTPGEGRLMVGQTPIQKGFLKKLTQLPKTKQSQREKFGFSGAMILQ